MLADTVREMLEDSEIIRVNGTSVDVVDGVDAPEAWVTFLNRDEEYEVEDIQIESDSWELLELNGDGGLRAGEPHQDGDR